MGELLGWSGIGLESGTAAARLRAMGEARPMALPSGAGALRALAPQIYAECAVSGTWTAGSPGEVLAALEGEVRWDTAELTSIAAQEGHAGALLAAFRQHGIDFVSHLRGSFAAAVLAPRQQLAVLAVDRAGIRPLCFRQTQGGMVFASSADAVRAFAATSAAIDAQSVFDFCYFHVIPSPATIFKEIRKLEPAQMLVMRGGRAELMRYWRPTFFTGATVPDRDALQSQLRETVRTAVADTQPDAHSACFLSGGCDSSTVAGMLQSLQSKPARTYSIGFAEAGYDESEYARTVVEHFGLDGKEVRMAARDVESLLPSIVAAYDEPFANSSAAPTLFCAQAAASDGVRHMLAGDGGDELFAGNERYAKQRVFEWYFGVPAPLRKALEAGLQHAGPARRLGIVRKAVSYVHQANMPVTRRMDSYNFLNLTPLETVFDPAFLATIDPRHPLEVLREPYESPASADMLDRMLYLDWKITLADNDLRKVNRMCELAGVRVSYPLLNDSVVELSTQVPPEWKMRGLRLRHFYKDTFRNFLPQKVLTKKKHGFGLPVGEWLRGSPVLNEMALDALASVRARGVFRDAFIDELLTAHRRGDAGFFGKMIWVLVMLEMFLQSRGYHPNSHIV